MCFKFAVHTIVLLHKIALHWNWCINTLHYIHIFIIIIYIHICIYIHFRISITFICSQ